MTTLTPDGTRMMRPDEIESQEMADNSAALGERINAEIARQPLSIQERIAALRAQREAQSNSPEQPATPDPVPASFSLPEERVALLHDAALDRAGPDEAEADVIRGFEPKGHRGHARPVLPGDGLPGLPGH